MIEIKIAENLRQLMKDCNVNQVQLAKEIGVAQSAVSAWLHNLKEPSITSLWLLADYFNCNVDELIGRHNI
ncbi:MAG: helix-turn-helix domain-containing protein [Clostridia bacterium]|nr:helix-turn-helix domain-containing protein [Clostridia bacterium]